MNEIKYNLPNEIYHSGDELSCSGAKLIADVPKKYWGKYIDPTRIEKKSTIAIHDGIALHCAILEPESFYERYAIEFDKQHYPEALDTVKDLKDWIEAKGYKAKGNKPDLIKIALDIEPEVQILDVISEQFNGVNNSKTQISENLFRLVEKCHIEARNHPELAPILNHPLVKFEASIYFMRAGVQCKIRPDIHIPPCAEYHNGIIVDLKKVADASQRGFGKALANYDYHLQDEFYSFGFQEFFKTKEKPIFRFFCQELESPFLNACYTLTDSNLSTDLSGLDVDDNVDVHILDYAKTINERAIEAFKQCKETGIWHGYPTCTQVLQIPRYLQIQANEFSLDNFTFTE